jgi:hypothetical protein
MQTVTIGTGYEKYIILSDDAFWQNVIIDIDKYLIE